MNATEDGIAAFMAYAADPDASIFMIFQVERAYEVDTRDIDEEWMP
ncbi:hypothetical protein [Streptomyces hokutonensis]